MSVSGPGATSGPSWDGADSGAEPLAPPADATDAAALSRTPTSSGPARSEVAAQTLLADLQGVAAGNEAALPGWLSWLDSSSNVHAFAKKALLDGKVTDGEVRDLVKAAYDWGEMQSSERDALVSLLRENPATFTAAGREALSKFLSIENPMPADPTGPTDPTGTQPIDLGLPKIAGKSYQIHPDGYPVEAGQTQGPPGLRGEGAERIYRAGKALVEAPKGVLRAVPAPVQQKMLDAAVGQYEAGLREVQSSPVSPTDANRVRSGAAATMLALVEGGATAEIREAAAAKLAQLGLQEPVEGLRASIYLNLESQGSALPASVGADLAALKETVLPSKPPYDEWFPNGDERFEVVHYAHEQCWEHATDPVTRYKQIGLEVKEEGTNARGEKYWILEGKIDGGNGKKQDTRIRLVQSHKDFARDLDNPDINAVIYTGHSNLGGNISEAIRRGPKENGKKLLSFQLCRGQQNIYEVANKYPNADLQTSHDPSYFANMMDIAIGTLKGVARRDTYDGIRDGTRMSYRAESINNYIRPNELRRYEWVDQDHDGQPELGLDARDRFFDVTTREVPANATDLVPRDVDTPAEDLDASAVMNGVNFARTLVYYHVDHGPGSSPLKDIEGDRIEAAGFFEGSDEPVRVTETTGRDGKPVYNVAVNKAYAGQSAYAIGALVQYEFTKYIAEKDGTFSPSEKARALIMVGEYLSYMYCGNRESEAIARSIGNRAGVSGLTFGKLYEAIETDGSGYSTDKQVEELMKRVTIR